MLNKLVVQSEWGGGLDFLNLTSHQSGIYLQGLASFNWPNTWFSCWNSGARRPFREVQEPCKTPLLILIHTAYCVPLEVGPKIFMFACFCQCSILWHSLRHRLFEVSTCFSPLGQRRRQERARRLPHGRSLYFRWQVAPLG